MSEQKELSYFQIRCNAIGLTKENNKLLIPQYAAQKDSPVIEMPLLCEDEKTGDILIPLYDLRGDQCYFANKPTNAGSVADVRKKYVEIRRYKPGNERIITTKGKETTIKYDNPKGAKSLPWIAPNIIEAVRTGKEIDTIVITEGYIKSLSGYLNGLYIFGLAGIQNVKDTQTGTLHPDILTTIKTCKVKNIILLYDGDCTQISLKALEEERDLYARPNGFFTSARNIVELLKDHRKNGEFDVYFAHINTEELELAPKGLDDLFEAYITDLDSITTELTSFSRTKNHYFKKFNITGNLTKVFNHLHIATHEQFYTAHNQIIKEKPFIFHGTKYQFDTEKNELKLIIPGAAKNYFRVGDHYYEKLYIPNKNGVLEYQYHRRQSGTIVSDHNKNFMQHIAKYKAFCAKPDHVNYQEIINSCFNRYKPFEHEADETQSDCPETLNFLTHIFGDQLEIGLDYIQILYRNPTQMLPILCLVSKENNTGKSTFVKLLKAIFTGNMALIGNADLENDFNASWADKLLVACEESFIDKKKTIEKIKALSTGDKIVMNQKGVDQIEIDCFLKFIFCSNNEDNFLIANEHDERFWVRRVPKATTERTNLLDLMLEEIPQFLCYLNKRTLVNKKESRMHFTPAILKTEALRKLINANKSGAEREITTFMRGMFLEHGFLKLEYNLKYIVKEVLRNRFDTNYIERILKENIKVKPTLTTKRYKYPVIITTAAENNANEEKIVLMYGNGKPYLFEANMFCSQDEISTIQVCEYAKSIGQTEEQETLPF